MAPDGTVPNAKNPDAATAKFAAGLRLHRAGRLAEAEGAYGEALTIDPEHGETLHLLGVLAYQRGDAEVAVGLIEKAVARMPDFADAYSNLGLALTKTRDFGRAEAALNKAIALNPDAAAAHCNLGEALKAQARHGDAATAFAKAVEVQPDCVAAHHGRGVALHALGRLNEACAAFRLTLRLEPDHAEALNNLGAALNVLGRTGEAATVLRRAVALKPDFAQAWNNLGNTLRDDDRLTEAVAAFRRCLDVAPDFAEAHNNLGNALQAGCALAEAEASYRRAVLLKPSFATAHSNLIYAMNHNPTYGAADMLAEARRWNNCHARAFRRAPRDNARDPDRRLRVGYVSPDLRAHSVSYFFEPLIAAHDRAAVKTLCYAEVPRPDAVTARLRGHADIWRDTVGMSDTDLARRVRDDRVDILVDLAGHTAGGRLGVFARKPAPVQITWLGYGSTTGLGEMDYRFTDAIADPEGEADRAHTETLARLPGGFLCYKPPSEAPDVAPPPAKARGHVTFGSFNNLAKVTPWVVALWADVLSRVPDSRLIVKSRALADDTTRERYQDLFVGHGVALGRIDFLAWIESDAGHLGAYGEIDIALDAFPYNGTTTTCEALWMGVPVVSLGGDWHQTRVGASLLHRVGLDGLAVDTAAAYVEAAARLAGDLDRLAASRARLRQTMAASPLCDADAFARDVEDAYRQFWRAWCAGDPRP